MTAADPAVAELIREVLAEELARLRTGTREERVRIADDADLAAFAKRMLALADDRDAREALEKGALVFRLDAGSEAAGPRRASRYDRGWCPIGGAPENSDSRRRGHLRRRLTFLASGDRVAGGHGPHAGDRAGASDRASGRSSATRDGEGTPRAWRQNDASGARSPAQTRHRDRESAMSEARAKRNAGNARASVPGRARCTAVPPCKPRHDGNRAARHWETCIEGTE